MKLCEHCGGDIAIRNPKGFCDHLYYPENCKICDEKINGIECHACRGTGRIKGDS